MQRLLGALLVLTWTGAALLLPGVGVQASSSDRVSMAGAALAAPATAASPIPAAQLTLSVSSGSTGTPLTISGSGFPPGEIVAIYIDAAGPYLPNPPPGPRADAQGTVRVSLAWPGKNYDPSGHVDPTIAGPHTVCGDTAYPGSAQRIPARGCAQFIVVAAPVTPTPSPVASDTSSFPVGTALIGFVVLMLLGGGVLLFTRRSK
jgi:hypothetical protein